MKISENLIVSLTRILSISNPFFEFQAKIQKSQQYVLIIIILYHCRGVLKT